ncbi:MAG TPA: hypothetical protein V6C81_19420 [Planktothrix sp.]
MDGSQILCQISTGQEDDWKNLYEAAFPADERHPVEDLRKLITKGSVLLHKTVNKSGELLCFSITNMMSNFCLLAYIATDSTKRSTGVGSKHMKRLIDELKQSHPNHLGVFLEIESTKETGLDAETQKARTRRLAFYQRLGCKRLHKTYLMPSYGSAHGTHAPREAELLWSEFQTACVTESHLPAVIEEIFCKAYGLPKTDPTVQKVLAQFPTPNSACAGQTETPSTTSTTSGASAAVPVATPTASTPAQPAATAPQPPASTASVLPCSTAASAKVEATPAPAKVDATPAPAKLEATPAPAKVETPPAPAKLETTPAPAKVEATPAPAKVEAPAPAKVVVQPAPAKVEAPPAPAKVVVVPPPAVTATATSAKAEVPSATTPKAEVADAVKGDGAKQKK